MFSYRGYTWAHSAYSPLETVHSPNKIFVLDSCFGKLPGSVCSPVTWPLKPWWFVVIHFNILELMKKNCDRKSAFLQCPINLSYKPPSRVLNENKKLVWQDGRLSSNSESGGLVDKQVDYGRWCLELKQCTAMEDGVLELDQWEKRQEEKLCDFIFLTSWSHLSHFCWVLT